MAPSPRPTLTCRAASGSTARRVACPRGSTPSRCARGARSMAAGTTVRAAPSPSPPDGSSWAQPRHPCAPHAPSTRPSRASHAPPTPHLLHPVCTGYDKIYQQGGRTYLHDAMRGGRNGDGMKRTVHFSVSDEPPPSPPSPPRSPLPPSMPPTPPPACANGSPGIMWSSNVVGCDGHWAGGLDNAESACAVGWHVCTSAAELSLLGASDCSSVPLPTGGFYATKDTCDAQGGLAGCGNGAPSAPTVYGRYYWSSETKPCGGLNSVLACPNTTQPAYHSTGVGKCQLLDGSTAASSYETYTGVPGCKQRCDLSDSCTGYAVHSSSGHCYIYTAAPLTATGTEWSGASCMQSSPRSRPRRLPSRTSTKASRHLRAPTWPPRLARRSALAA